MANTVTYAVINLVAVWGAGCIAHSAKSARLYSARLYSARAVRNVSDVKNVCERLQWTR